MLLKQSMEKISQLSREAAAKDEELHKKHGLELGLTMGDPASQAYVLEARHLATPLTSYLESLDVTQLKKLVTLMYAGRDVTHFQDAGSPATFHDDLKRAGVHDKDKAAYIRNITEKMLSLAHYFDSAVEQLRKLGSDPDADLAHVA